MKIKYLGLVNYADTLTKMQNFTITRDENTQDEIWLLEHNKVFTSGVRDIKEHLLTNPDNIPIISTDRGGLITYHAKGQIIAYCLFDIKRMAIGVKQLVYLLEQSIIDLLSIYEISGKRLTNSPGIFVCGEKIAALGLKIKNGCSYHGISLNVAMDLTPFNYINPCGYQNLKITQIANQTSQKITQATIIKQLADILATKFTTSI